MDDQTLKHLPLAARGKVRDVYDLGDRLLMVASDRISAFDVVMPTPIPDKGTVKLDGWTGTDDVGKPCTSNSQCQGGLCAQNTHTGVWFCTKQCDRCAATPCPTGSGCQNAGPFYICAPGYPNAPC